MIDTDAVIIGAGPVGLFQVFQLGLLGMRAEVIDVLPEPGGQCMALYPDKPIFDIPGVPRCTGRELTEQLLKQAGPFLPRDAAAPVGRAQNLRLGQLVSELTPRPEGGFNVATTAGLHLQCQAVFIAAGAGAFVPRTLALPGIEGGANVHHHLGHAPGPAPWAGQHLVVWGGGDEALSAAAMLAEMQEPAGRPSRLTLLHRRDQYQAEPALEARVRGLIAEGRLEAATGLPTGTVQSDEGAVSALHLLAADGITRELPLDHLMIRLGMSPKLGPLVDWGLALERKQLSVSPASFECSTPGIYAVGDINTYPGKKRLLLCGFHEATLAAHHAATRLHPDAPQHLLYTTTSPLLHQRLGVVDG